MGTYVPSMPPLLCPNLKVFGHEAWHFALAGEGTCFYTKHKKSFILHKKSNGHSESEDHSDGASVSNWLLGSSDVSTVLTWSLLRWGHSPYEVGAFPLRDGDISLTRWVWGARASSGGRPLDRVVGQLGRVANRAC